MADLTLSSGQSLPPYCALIGVADAPVQKSGTFTVSPRWLWILMLLPFGFVIFLAARQLFHREYVLTYFLSQTGVTQMKKRRLGIRLLLIFGALSFLPSLILKLPLLLIVPLVAMPLGIWLDHRYGWPFTARRYTATSVTLADLPSQFQTAASTGQGPEV